MLGVLARDVESGALPERHAVALIATLVSAGHEPAINQVALMASLLSHYPDVWEATADGDLDPSTVVEAVLRFRSTNQGVLRQVTEPVELDGVAFKVGESLIVNTAAANRDPRQFDDPDRFRVDADSLATPRVRLRGALLPRRGARAVQLQEALLALVDQLSCPSVITESDFDGGGLVGISSLVISFTARPKLRV